MQTNFTPVQLADAGVQEADSILRKCVHCGFCLSTCPTYALLSDERDSPRGRIYLMKDMLESGEVRDTAVRHIDRCLSCLACTTSCPSGVDYMHLVDGARARIEAEYTRPLSDRLFRALLAVLLPRPWLFRLSLIAAIPGRWVAWALPARLRRLVATAPRGGIPAPSPVHAPQVFAAHGPRRKRVALVQGCVQQVLGGRISEATVRVLRGQGCEVVVSEGAGCCGALPHHLGRLDEAKAFAKRNIAAWIREDTERGLDAIVLNASGCGTTLRDYGHMFSDDPEWRDRAARVAALARDVSEVLTDLGGSTGADLLGAPSIAYHDSCSLRHGQGITRQPRDLLAKAGFVVAEVGEGHMCCGAAGTYNVLQPEIADQLGARKAANLAQTGAGAMACANLGCMLHLARFSDLPMVHTVELLDWAAGGPRPEPMARGPVANQ